MSSPSKKKGKKPNKKGKKRNNSARTPSRPQKKKASKKGPYRQWTKGQKEIREHLVKIAAEQIIEARTKNPLNKQGENPKVPRGLYSSKAEGINQHTNGLEVTAVDLENKVRAIDRDRNRKRAASTQLPVPSTTAISTSSLALENANDAIAPSHLSSKVSPSDSNTSSVSYSTVPTSSQIAQQVETASSCSYSPCFLSGKQDGLGPCSTKGCTRQAHQCCQIGYRTTRQAPECSIMPPRRCQACEDEYLSASNVASTGTAIGLQSNHSNADMISADTKSNDSDSDSDASPRRLESALEAAVTYAHSTSNVEESAIPPPHPPDTLGTHDGASSTSIVPSLHMDPLPSAPIPSSFILDKDIDVSASNIVQLNWAMREAPRHNPGSEHHRHEAGEIIIIHPRKAGLVLTQENFSRLQPDVWLCDGIINFILAGVFQEETTGTHFLHTTFMGQLLHFGNEDELWRHAQEQSTQQSGNANTNFDFEDDGLEVLGTKSDGNQEFYDFGRIERLHKKIAKYHGVDSIFDLKSLFIPIHKDGNHWIFIMVNMDSKEICLWDSFGRNSNNDVYPSVIQKYLFDVSVDVTSQDETGTFEDWTKSWSIVDHSNEWPRQRDGHSCGIFILLGMYCLSHGLELTPSSFSQQDIYDMNMRMRLALILWSYRSGEEALVAPPTAVRSPSVAPLIPPAAAPKATTLPPTAAPPSLPDVPSSQPSPPSSSATATDKAPSGTSRNMGGRPVGTTKKNAAEKKKAAVEATNYVVVEYANAQKEAKKSGKSIVPRGTRVSLVEDAKDMFDVGDDFDVPSSTIDSRIKAGNLEVFRPGEDPIVLPLEPIFVTFILKSAVSGNPLRVGESIALCNEILRSSAKYKAKVIAWKKDRGIFDPDGWLLGYAWWKGFRMRNEGIITATVGRKFAQHRANHCHYPAFEKMYGNLEDALVASGNAVKLKCPVHMDMHGRVVHEEDALGWLVTHGVTRPENVFVLDETGGNTNGKSDCRNGGERVMAPWGEVVADIIGAIDSHFTVTPVADLTGRLRAIQVIFKGKTVPEGVALGLDPFVALEGDKSVEANMGPGKRFPGCNITDHEGNPVPVILDCSENASQTGETFLNLFKKLDMKGIGLRGVDENGISYEPAVFFDGHGSREALCCLDYWNHDAHPWTMVLGAPYGTSHWQPHDNSRQNGKYKQKLAELMRKHTVKKAAFNLPQEIRPQEVLPLVESAANVSFNNPQSVQAALAESGVNPLNRNRLDDDAILRTAPEHVQKERRRVSSLRHVHTNNTARLSGTQADLLNEGSGYFLGGGDAAKKAVEQAVSGLQLDGHYVDNIFELVERRRKLVHGRNKHMEKQAARRTTSEELREQYASSKRMTSGTIFAKGNGLLQEEARDEIRRRAQLKTSKLNAAARKKKKALWELSLEVENVRDRIVVKHMKYLRDKGIPSAEEVKESDLGEDQIRTLRNDDLKTLIKWKKISSDAAIPTKKDTLVTRLMATMGRRSPQASPYNSDDEEYDEDHHAEGGPNAEGEDEDDEEVDEEVDEEDT